MSISSNSARGDRTTVRTFNVRSSGRDLSAVRRPGVVGIDVPVPAKGDVQTEAPAPEPTEHPLPTSSESKPAKNDGAVKTKKSDG